jgi:hypothetical protein
MRDSSTGWVRIDWQAERDRIDLAEVAASLLGPPHGRRGSEGRLLWWSCPLGTHEDRNPSFCVDPVKRRWRCFGCGEHGDVATLLMKLQGMTFPEAVSYLTGGPALPWIARPRRKSFPRTEAAPPPDRPKGMPEADALALVREAAARLWSLDGSDALAHLTGRRLLSPETIRAARLGVIVEPLSLPGRPRGIVIPWFEGERLALVKLRQPEGRTPKYRETFRDRPSLYPGRLAIRTGRPLVIVEGEFDALLLGQELAELAAVVTLGSASGRPDPGILGTMLPAAPWIIATDRDAAGEKAAAGWPDQSRRVRPPAPFKDWTEARQGGVDLRRWWSDYLGGEVAPSLFSWKELAGWRWGRADADPSPGIVIDSPREGDESAYPSISMMRQLAPGADSMRQSGL